MLPPWLLKVTQGLMTSMNAAPPWPMAPLDERHQLPCRLRSCAMGGAQLQRQADQVHRAVVVDHALLLREPRSAVAENWPLVRP